MTAPHNLRTSEGGAMLELVTGGARERRDLAQGGLQGDFEGSLYEEVYPDLLLGDTRAVAAEIYAALTNTEWFREDGGGLAYSFRAAADLIACMRREGDYLDWHCCAEPGRVSDRIASGLWVRGWRHRPAFPPPEAP